MTHGRANHPTSGGGMKVFHRLRPHAGGWRCTVCTHTWPDLPPLAARSGCPGPPPPNVIPLARKLP